MGKKSYGRKPSRKERKEAIRDAQIQNGCLRKKRYDTVEDAQKAIDAYKGWWYPVNAYPCSNCGGAHIGRAIVNEIVHKTKGHRRHKRM